MPADMMADEESATAFTAEELAEYNGLDGAPAYLAILGRVYDVSAGKSFYGAYITSSPHEDPYLPHC